MSDGEKRTCCWRARKLPLIWRTCHEDDICSDFLSARLAAYSIYGSEIKQKWDNHPATLVLIVGDNVGANQLR
jgi:hypothetical protein